MIITLDAGAPAEVAEAVEAAARRYEGVRPRTYVFQGADQVIREVHLIGSTGGVPTEPFEEMVGVRHVVRVSTRYRLIGRHERASLGIGFEYNGVSFDERTVKIFAGLCAVDTPENVDRMMAALAEAGITTARMGAYKPRTSPYDFQGLAEDDLGERVAARLPARASQLIGCVLRGDRHDVLARGRRVRIAERGNQDVQIGTLGELTVLDAIVGALQVLHGRRDLDGAAQVGRRVVAL